MKTKKHHKCCCCHCLCHARITLKETREDKCCTTLEYNAPFCHNVCFHSDLKCSCQLLKNNFQTFFISCAYKQCETVWTVAADCILKLYSIAWLRSRIGKCFGSLPSTIGFRLSAFNEDVRQGPGVALFSIAGQLKPPRCVSEQPWVFQE